jgi:serine protease Do
MTGYQVVVEDPLNVKELKVNDVIIGINNQQVSTIGEISDIVSSHKIGDVLTLTVVRDRRYVEVDVTLVEYIPYANEKQHSQG